MSDFFDDFEVAFAHAAGRQRHRRWYQRALIGHGRRALSMVIASLVIATPAVGAVTNWFGLGAPDHFPQQSATLFQGAAIGGTAKLASSNVPDPQGGPGWGLRLVKTTRGDTCIQIGRVQGDQIGSLGTDSAWNDDRLFHPFPNTSVGDDCGTTDAQGHGFVNFTYWGTQASANPTIDVHGVQAKSCRPLKRNPIRDGPVCPRGSLRLIFAGLLGPDAVAISYEGADGKVHQERTSGPDGAYLLVFRADGITCRLFSRSLFSRQSQCIDGESVEGASPNGPTSIRSITYRDGKTCDLDGPPGFAAALNVVEKRMNALSGPGRRAAAAKLWAAFLRHVHMTGRQVTELGVEPCPPVGLVTPKLARVTRAMVAAPVKVTMTAGSQWCSRRGRYRPNSFNEIGCDHSVPEGYERFRMYAKSRTAPGVLINIQSTARVAVTSSRAYYDIQITNPARSGCDRGISSQLGFGNLKAGTTLRFQDWVGVNCTGEYSGEIGYFENSGPDDDNSGGDAVPGQPGWTTVARFRFRLR